MKYTRDLPKRACNRKIPRPKGGCPPLSVIVTQAGADGKEYRRLLADDQVPLPKVCPTCNQPGLRRNGFYRRRQVKTTSPREAPREYPVPPEYIDMIKLVCRSPDCHQRHHTILPSFLAPFGQYAQPVRQAALDAVDLGATLYSVAAKLHLFPLLIKRWRLQEEALAKLAVPKLLAEAQARCAQIVTQATLSQASPWWRLAQAALLLLAVLLGRDRCCAWTPQRRLEFVYVFCSAYPELRLWDRRKTAHPINLALSLPAPGG